MYALDDARVLRLLHGTGSAPGRKALCDELASDALGFGIPCVHEEGVIDGTSYSIEERIVGRPFASMLPELSGERRERALAAYADAADALKGLNGTRPWFGEVARPDPIRRDSWSEVLAVSATRALARKWTPIRRDVPDVDRILARFVDEVAEVEGVQAGMVHADYFPGNVLLTEDLTVSGVIDFGVMTMYGDHRLDLVSAIGFFAETNDWFRPGDDEFLTGYLTAIEPSLPDVLDLYRTYYALYFSYCETEDEELYAWCVDVLNEA